jgi:hypothetical protein
MTRLSLRWVVLALFLSGVFLLSAGQVLGQTSERETKSAHQEFLKQGIERLSKSLASDS